MKVELVPHNPAWAGLADAESQRWLAVLGEGAVVHHIGSTAIAGIMAKPVIDLMPVVPDVALVDERGVVGLGYEWRGEFGIAGRRFCTRNAVGGERLFNVHIFGVGSPEVSRHLAFRDYLRAFRNEALEYERVKLAAAALCPDDVLAYNEAKSGWLKGCEQRALLWTK